MVFPPQQAATDLDKKETSHFTHSDTFPIPAEEKQRIQSLVKPLNRCTVPICRVRWSHVFAEVA